MLNTRENTQNEIEFVSIDELVPDNHLLRKIDKYIDFSFIIRFNASIAFMDVQFGLKDAMFLCTSLAVLQA